ncbi:MAG: four helix bundle protein [Saprospiraceae bacterium]|nr:four helix bundle protein [Saprospiraceae bacterium]
MEIVKLTYEQIRKLPKVEDFGLKSQMQRAAVSIPSNIAEGCSRKSNKELARYLEIAIGSSFELETQMIACQMIGYVNQQDLDSFLPKVNLFQKKTNAYLSTLG